ncbi:hypothetical protein AB3K25_09800 [Leuconostoc sp. MS02]|uniref:Uncharacterized protein n=1 Tax=Leuconostoc aquikimchii TaxID=3236804 RepID=A0ABV3S085_9LACO
MDTVIKHSLFSGIVFGILLVISNFVIDPVKNTRIIPMAIFILFASLIMGLYVYWYGKKTKIGQKHYNNLARKKANK